MKSHSFIFEPGIWLGQGKITFTTSPETLRFYTKWVVAEADSAGKICCQQFVEREGVEEILRNTFCFTPISATVFTVEFQNELIGAVLGMGLIEEKSIAWNFPKSHFEQSEEALQGKETFILQENGDYLFHAEYLSRENDRNHITGRIWKKI